MLRPGHAIVLAALGLLTLGVVMVNSAGMSMDPSKTVTLQTVVTSKPVIFMALALIAMFVMSRLNWDRALVSDWTARWIPMLVPITLVALATVYLPHIGKEVNGSRRWLQMPGTSFQAQPSEIAKWAMVLVVAWFVTRRASKMESWKHGFLPGALLIGFIAAFVAKEDLGTGALILATGCVMLIAGGAKIAHFLPAIPVAAAGFAVAVIASPYRVKRLTAFLDPYGDAEKTGFHMIQSLSAVANGNLFGRGLGFGVQKFGYLPEDTTDFVFAIICEELGAAGALLVLFLYAVVIWAGWAIVKRQTSQMAKLVALGVVVTFGLQAIINLLVVTGLAPTKGIALPLISSGGTGWILTSASLGILLALDRADARREAAAQQNELTMCHRSPLGVVGADPQQPTPVISTIAAIPG
ncbi:MAG TPA: putative peptidoglycan glycosyltransferase FtsW [Phycisphaerales bacterium]|nr:putative peptidoglycan glycosyltransferase FtsW [Phycisphaerales bacterium]